MVQIKKTFQDELYLYIQMEQLHHGELWDACRTFGLISEHHYQYFAAHIVKAVSWRHNKYDIVHRDLKPENIMLAEDNWPKLIDFGTSKDLTRPDLKGSGNGLKGKTPFYNYVGTPNYMAPECIHNRASEKVSDIYSLGGVLYFLKVGAPPFTGGSEFIVYKKSLNQPIFLCQ